LDAASSLPVPVLLECEFDFIGRDGPASQAHAPGTAVPQWIQEVSSDVQVLEFRDFVAVRLHTGFVGLT